MTNDYKKLEDALIDLRIALGKVYDAIGEVEDGEELVTTSAYPFRNDLQTAIGDTFDWFIQIAQGVEQKKGGKA